MNLLRAFLRGRRGAALVEHALLVAGIAVVAVVAVSVLGHETSDLLGSAAAVLPGVNADDSGPITSGELIETTDGGTGPIRLDVERIVDHAGAERLGDNLGYDVGDLPELVVHQDD